MNRFWKTLAPVAVCTLFASLAPAQKRPFDTGLSPADAKEVRSYALTMDKIQKMAAASRALAEAGKNHPDMKNMNQGRSIDAMLSDLQRYPDAVSAITRKGLSPREYLDCLVALMQSSMAVGFKKAGAFQQNPAELSQSVSDANLNFTEQHWIEIQKILGGIHAAE